MKTQNGIKWNRSLSYKTVEILERHFKLHWQKYQHQQEITFNKILKISSRCKANNILCVKGANRLQNGCLWSQLITGWQVPTRLAESTHNFTKQKQETFTNP